MAAPPDDFGLDQRQIMLQPGWPAMAFVEKRLAGDPTSWWAANHACAEAMLRSCGIRVVRRLMPEVYWCELDGKASEDDARVQAETGLATWSMSQSCVGRWDLQEIM